MLVNDRVRALEKLRATLLVCGALDHAFSVGHRWREVFTDTSHYDFGDSCSYCAQSRRTSSRQSRGKNMPCTLAALWRSHFLFALSLAGSIYLDRASVLGTAPRTASRLYRTDCDRCRVVSPYGTPDPPAQKPFGA